MTISIGKISAKELYDFDIIEPTGLSELLEGLINPEPKHTLAPALSIHTKSNDPPILLYTESRGEDNRLNSISWYGGNGATGMMFHSGSRHTLELNSKYITDHSRGAILSFFCQIEFCIDALVCVGEGVFENKLAFSSLCERFDDKNGDLATTEQKIHYLESSDQKLISKRTAELLRRAKVIRNAISHQFLIQNLGLSEADLERYDSPIQAVELISSAAWLAILNDYSPTQLVVAKWLLKRSEDTSSDNQL